MLYFNICSRVLVCDGKFFCNKFLLWPLLSTRFKYGISAVAVNMMMFFFYFYLWISLFVIAENSTEDAKFFSLFERGRGREKKKRTKWCLRIHTSFWNIFIFCFNFVVICVFPPVFFFVLSRAEYILARDETRSLGFFPQIK